METILSQEAEEYLEMIYRLQKRDGMAKTKELAEALHVVPGSITNTIEHLESHCLVAHVPYRGVKLTVEGEKVAVDILRRHRLAERLLTDILKAEWSNVHEDACKLEHALTKKMTALIEKRLGHPKFCPHGNPIPSEDGSVYELSSISLVEATVGHFYIVNRIIDEEPQSLRLLVQKKITPEVVLQVLQREAQEIVVRVEGRKQRLERALAANVMLREKEGGK